MPRIRSLKPDLWQDEAMADLSRDSRLLFIGLITQADDSGRLRGDARLIASQVFPYDTLSSEEVDGWLSELDRAGLIARYAHTGKPYIHLNGWRHQRIDRPQPSQLPSPDVVGVQGVLGGDSPVKPDQTRTIDDQAKNDPRRIGREGIGEEGKGENNTSAIDIADPPLCTLLADLIEKNGSKRLMLSGDERNHAEAEKLLRWAQADEFWRSNILSMPKFREKYDTLRLQANRSTVAAPRSTLPPPAHEYDFSQLPEAWRPPK